MAQIFDSDGIPKHRKKKKSNTSKSSEKSNHKHIYRECFINYPLKILDKTRTITSLASYCEICGKVGSRLENSIIPKDKIRYLSTINYEEFKDVLPLFEIDGYYDKYVDLKKDEGDV